jgi:hypothetical protein
VITLRQLRAPAQTIWRANEPDRKAAQWMVIGDQGLSIVQDGSHISEAQFLDAFSGRLVRQAPASPGTDIIFPAPAALEAKWLTSAGIARENMEQRWFAAVHKTLRYALKNHFVGPWHDKQAKTDKVAPLAVQAKIAAFLHGAHRPDQPIHIHAMVMGIGQIATIGSKPNDARSSAIAPAGNGYLCWGHLDFKQVHYRQRELNAYYEGSLDQYYPSQAAA